MQRVLVGARAVLKKTTPGFEWHLCQNEIVTCFLNEQGHRYGVSYIFKFASPEAARQAFETENDPMVLVRVAWEAEQREIEKAERKLLRKLKKKYENVNPDSTAPGALE